MARLEDKIAEIRDQEIRRVIADEVRELKALLVDQRRFGLVFEGHQPELVPIFSKAVQKGQRVAKKLGLLHDTWLVASVSGSRAEIVREADGTRETVPLDRLVAVRTMGEPIYPALVPRGEVVNGDAASPHHVLIEADNYHALQLLDYIYRGRVDCIYIDPPYNTGSRDWKYNNDFVDKNDSWRHSKWLSMMKKRLGLAQRLLKSDGIMCVTIDDYELAHIVMLLEDMPGANIIATVPIKNKPQGRPTANGFSVNHEYALFVSWSPSAQVGRLPRRGTKAERYPEVDEKGIYTWSNFRKSGSDSSRSDRPKQFYPVYVKGESIRIPEMQWDEENEAWTDIESPKTREEVIWPVDAEGEERVWTLGNQRARDDADELRVVRGANGTQIYRKYRPNQEGSLPGTWWDDPLYSASESGTKLLQRILGENRFSYPKSLYAVVDCLRACGAGANPNAVVLDFFAGSATTLHAVNVLNALDGGKRQCVQVTNNELSEADSSKLASRNKQPGDDEWEAKGICRSVTWPRCKFTVLGKRDNGTKLTGQYLSGRKVVQSRPRQIKQLGFADGRRLTLTQRKQVASLIDGVSQSAIDGESPWYLNAEVPASVLWDVSQAEQWLKALKQSEHVTDFYVVTPESRAFSSIRSAIKEQFPPVSVLEDEKRPLAEGFAANVTYFKLDFLDPTEVQLGKQFKAILPILWMMAGSIGSVPAAPAANAPWLIPENSPFAVLLHDSRFKDFRRHITGRQLTHVFIVTNSRDAYWKLREELGAKHVVQLYKDYLDNFKINLVQDLI
jgi:adenine-specific DNA-methyltransferase